MPRGPPLRRSRRHRKDTSENDEVCALQLLIVSFRANRKRAVSPPNTHTHTQKQKMADVTRDALCAHIYAFLEASPHQPLAARLDALHEVVDQCVLGFSGGRQPEVENRNEFHSIRHKISTFCSKFDESNAGIIFVFNVKQFWRQNWVADFLEHMPSTVNLVALQEVPNAGVADLLRRCGREKAFSCVASTIHHAGFEVVLSRNLFWEPVGKPLRLPFLLVCDKRAADNDASDETPAPPSPAEQANPQDANPSAPEQRAAKAANRPSDPAAQEATKNEISMTRRAGGGAAEVVDVYEDATGAESSWASTVTSLRKVCTRRGSRGGGGVSKGEAKNVLHNIPFRVLKRRGLGVRDYVVVGSFHAPGDSKTSKLRAAQLADIFKAAAHALKEKIPQIWGPLGPECSATMILVGDSNFKQVDYCGRWQFVGTLCRLSEGTFDAKSSEVLPSLLLPKQGGNCPTRSPNQKSQEYYAAFVATIDQRLVWAAPSLRSTFVSGLYWPGMASDHDAAILSFTPAKPPENPQNEDVQIVAPPGLCSREGANDCGRGMRRPEKRARDPNSEVIDADSD